MNKRILLFSLSLIFNFCYQNNAVSMGWLLGGKRAPDRSSSEAVAEQPEAKKRKTQAEALTSAIKDSSVLFGQKVKGGLEDGLAESFGLIKSGVMSQKEIGTQVLHVMNQMLKDVLTLVFGKMDAVLLDVSQEKDKCGNGIKAVVLAIYLEKVKMFCDMARKKCCCESADVQLIDLLYTFISSKAKDGMEKGAELTKEVTGFDAVEKEISEFITKNHETIKSSTDIAGVAIIVLGRLAPMLTDILDDFIRNIPVQFQMVISEMGDCFAEQMSVLLAKGASAISQEDVTAMKSVLVDKLVKLLKEQIFVKVVEILNPRIAKVIEQTVNEFLPTGTKSVVSGIVNRLITSKLSSTVDNIADKIKTKLNENNETIMTELNTAITRILQVVQ